MRHRNAIFMVTEENLCPIYNVSEEFRVEEDILTLPEAKATCLVLAADIMGITSEKQVFERFTQRGVQKSKFRCGGCRGWIGFEYKREKEYRTPQMKMLAMADLRRKTKHLDRFATLLRKVQIFENMTANNLRDISAMLHVQEYPPNTPILQKNEVGTDLYIILSGKVCVVDDDGEVLNVMVDGEIFGEMSLLSGMPVTKTVRTADMSMVASLNNKDFRHMLNKYKDLQVVFYKMLVERATKARSKQQASDVSSGMAGQLAEVNPVELFQLINISAKTGKVELNIADGTKALVYFVDGNIVKADYSGLDDKEAIFTLLSKTDGRFTFTSEIPDEVKGLSMIGDFMGLVMEGMQRLDEE